MSDVDQLRDLGQQLAAALVASYGMTAPGAKLVFLPGGVSVPDDLVQPVPADPTKVLVNPTQMQTWLSMNFDSPFAITPGDGSVLEKDSSHGTASQIYTIAATSAQPLGAVGDDAWTRVDGEIAAAQRKLGEPDAIKTFVCEPDDWPVSTTNAGYWTKFDSSDTKTTSTQTTTAVPAVRPQFWMVRSLALAPTPSPAPAPPPPATAPPPRRFLPMQARENFAFQRPMAQRVAVSEMAVSRAPAAAPAAPAAPVVSAAVAHPMLAVAAWRTSAVRGVVAEKANSQILFQNFLPVHTVTTSTSSTIKIHLEHQCVTLGYYSAGQPWWDGAFLADQGWFVPGMSRGGLLPPADGGPDATFGLPVGLIIVQKLEVSGQWSAEAATALSSPGGTIGPLSLFGATAATAADGVTVTYSHDGMQVVALLCNALPVLPPADTPAAVATDLGQSSSASGGGPSAPPAPSTTPTPADPQPSASDAAASAPPATPDPQPASPADPQPATPS